MPRPALKRGDDLGLLIDVTRSRILGWIPALAGTAIVACSAPPLPESTTEASTATTAVDWSAFTLGPNDRIQVSVFGQPEFSTPPGGVRVGPEGTLGIPLLGDVSVLGKTASEVRATLETGLKEYLVEPAVTVSVLEYSSRRFHLLGEVRSAGPVAMDRPLTALEALSMGGGVLPGARLTPVVILRRQGEEDVEVIAFNAETPGPDGLIQVRPDDVLFVSKSGVGVFRESALPYLQGIGFTLSQVASVALAYDRLED